MLAISSPVVVASWLCPGCVAIFLEPVLIKGGKMGRCYVERTGMNNDCNDSCISYAGTTLRTTIHTYHGKAESSAFSQYLTLDKVDLPGSDLRKAIYLEKTVEQDEL